MFARTKRLTLRPPWPEDAAALAQAIGHEAVAMRLSRVPWPYGLAEAIDFLARPRAATEPYLLIVAHDAEPPRLVGAVSLTVEEGCHELGYWLTPSAWGRGYATEAGRAVIAIARHALPIDRLRARHHLDNPASAGVLTKLGFRSTGQTLPVRSLARDRAVDSAVMELDLTAADTGMAIAA